MELQLIDERNLQHFARLQINVLKGDHARTHPNLVIAFILRACSNEPSNPGYLPK